MATFSRFSKIMTLSISAHVLVGLSLWLSAQDLVAQDMPDPTVIDATILPPPSPTHDAVILPKNTVKTTQLIQKTKQTHAGNIKEQKGDGKQSGERVTTTSTFENDTAGQGGTDLNGKTETADNTSGAQALSAPVLTKGTPVDVAIKDGGFKILYDLAGDYKGFNISAGATFSFARSGSTYKAQLNSKSMGAGFNAYSEGEIRANTIATTSFKNGFTTLTKERGGSQFRVDYSARQVIFGSDNLAPLNVDVVYDYLSAMVYVQALLQQKNGRVSSLIVPVGKKNSIETATITFDNTETISTYEGKFEAISAKISIKSGSIESMRMWFVPEKNYRPLQIDIGIKGGKVRLISRESN